MIAVNTTTGLTQDPEEMFWIEKSPEEFYQIDPSCETRESSSEKESAHRGIGFSAPNVTGRHERKFSTTAPSWRIIRPGLNVEAECKSLKCSTAESVRRVWVNLGMGEIKMGEKLFTSKCPECQNEFSDEDFVRIGFWRCRYVVEGFQTAPEKKQISMKGECVKENSFTSFSEGKAYWAYLDITTEPLDAKHLFSKPKTEENSFCVLV